MNFRGFLKFVFAILCVLSHEVMAATGEEVANNLVLCGVIAEGGMSAANNQQDKKKWEVQRTLYLGSAANLTSIDYIRGQHAIAIERRKKLFDENPTAEKLSQIMSEKFNGCKEQLLENHSKIMEKSQAKKANQDGTESTKKSQSKMNSQFTPGVTTATEVISDLGKPSHEDQNSDGRFVYNYETQKGNDVYLFDKEKKLIRMRQYCDAIKGKCN